MRKHHNKLFYGKYRYKNEFNINNKIFYKENKFKGKIGIFEINKNVITHQLNFYSVENNKFKKIF